MKRLLLTVPAVLALAGCFPRTGPPPGAMTEAQLETVKSQWPDATVDSLEKGRHVFIDHCDHCHGYPDLTYLKPAEWPHTAERMGKKAELDAGETELLTRFIAAAYPPSAAAPAK